jgi:hypothetical protein
MDLGVCCECGRRLPVKEGDAGSSLSCSCGRKVVVPLLEEFQNRPLLLSAASVERRVQRLVAEGELPADDACARCGEVRATEVVETCLECEKSRTRTYGGFRFLIFPGFWVWWHEERRVEVRGRDTVVPVPLCLCRECGSRLGGPNRGASLAVVVSVLTVSALLTYFGVALGVGVGAAGLALWFWQKRRAWQRRQRELKSLLRHVPVYRQLLDKYPYATVLSSD